MKRQASVLVVGALLLGGCATKGDVRDLQDQLTAMRAEQEAMLREIQQQNAAIMDSLNMQEVRLRGDLTNQLVGIERQLVQIQELTGQGAAELAELRQQIRQREQAAATLAAPAAGTPEELFAASTTALESGSVSTARAGFEEFLRSFPEHPMAADAQFHIGMTYESEGDLERALEAFGRVLELYPASERAPTALYRAAVIEIERGNPDEARELFSRIVSAYPDSPEAPLARDRMEELEG